MRHVLIGLAAVASLAVSLIGGSGLGDVPPVAACNMFLVEDCGDREPEVDAYDACLESHRYDDYEYGHKWAAEKNEWADTHLAAEKAVAVYWRVPRVQTDCELGERFGQLYEVANPERTITYTCDPNYADAEFGGCVPADRDYDCAELRGWGMVNIYVYKPQPSASGGIEGVLGGVVELLPWTDEAPVVDPDWMLLDDDHDGLGCEFQPTTP